MIRQLLIYGILIACLFAPVHALTDKNLTKAVIVDYTLNGEDLTVVESRIIYGFAPDNIGQAALAVKVLSADNTPVSEFRISDPRILYLDKGSRRLDTVNFSIIMPFKASIASVDLYAVDIYNGTPTTLMGRADLTGTVRDFCAAHPKDPDCSTPFPLYLIGGGVLVLVVISGTAYLLLRKKGPAAGAENPP